ncbi:MAG: hypothetical protein R2836_01190 [Chitinophagales bacterium]
MKQNIYTELMATGMWSWYGGHDPEDYQHFVGDPKNGFEFIPILRVSFTIK